jgi:hypothetical protein
MKVEASEPYSTGLVRFFWVLPSTRENVLLPSRVAVQAGLDLNHGEKCFVLKSGDLSTTAKLHN